MVIHHYSLLEVMFMKRLADFSVKHPLIVVITVILITFVAVYFARGVTMTTDIKDFFLKMIPG